jgi:hypothetical protein
MKRFFFSGIILVFFFAVLGEMGRLPFGPGNGLLANDLLLPILISVWIFQKTFVDRQWPKTFLWAPFLTFIVIALISLLNGSRFLTLKETIISGLYLIRFIEYFFIAFITYDLAQDNNTKEKCFNGLLISAVAISILGFLQLKVFPDFTQMQDLGWDPHINRLLSTWFDPNFVGGMLAFILSLTSAKLIKKDDPTSKRFLIISGGIILIALFMTYSRSSYLALITSLGLIGLLRSRKLILFGILASLLLVSVSSRAQDRVSDLYYSAKSVLTETYELPDASARLRLDSWENAIVFIKDHPFLGIGYNTYSFTQHRYGFIGSLDDHAATGSDSTLLTIWATTGTIGLIAYLWILGSIFWKTYHHRDNPLALGVLTGTIGLLVHSIFVNSLLFTPLLIFFYSGIGLALNNSTEKTEPVIIGKLTPSPEQKKS